MFVCFLLRNANHVTRCMDVFAFVSQNYFVLLSRTMLYINIYIHLYRISLFSGYVFFLSCFVMFGSTHGGKNRTSSMVYLC